MVARRRDVSFNLTHPHHPERLQLFESYHGSTNAKMAKPQGRRILPSEALRQVSFLVQNPRLMTFREATAAIYIAVILYYTYQHFKNTGGLLFQTPISIACPGARTFGACVYETSWVALFLTAGWIWSCMSWALVALVVVFAWEMTAHQLREWRGR